MWQMYWGRGNGCWVTNEKASEVIEGRDDGKVVK